jgi:hypothetical protein
MIEHINSFYHGLAEIIQDGNSIVIIASHSHPRQPTRNPATTNRPLSPSHNNTSPSTAYHPIVPPSEPPISVPENLPRDTWVQTSPNRRYVV